MSGDVLLARDGGIVTVTLSAPERRNALNVFMWRKLGEVLSELDSDDSVRCVVLRGDGDEAFAAGADISEFETERSTAEQARAYALKTHSTLRTL
jgi:enoyl-CoA hydratase/carnithine racemase